ncbi:chemotaxis protein CheW [Candidatus Margulisiibacteriota bacterium]
MNQETTIKSDNQQILIFSLENEEFGLNISHIREVLRIKEIHLMVNTPRFIEGLINIREHVIAVINLRKKFHLKDIEKNPQNRIIICTISGFIVGLMVDSVSEVLTITPSEIEPTPEIVKLQIKTDYLQGIAQIGERVITLIDLASLLSKEEKEQLNSIKK